MRLLFLLHNIFRVVQSSVVANTPSCQQTDITLEELQTLIIALDESKPEEKRGRYCRLKFRGTNNFSKLSYKGTQLFTYYNKSRI
ncbi:hypothetical protein CEXT_457581 [Caerostris extrusa]|uniref:Secreted protein n=1 Tax=Caerostris extrusa TaxID=172846 RepID=A0AAV4MZY9_CAEEX|nr:hypothetical protein CEXT_457581 [Caerostris extrusa]